MKKINYVANDGYKVAYRSVTIINVMFQLLNIYRYICNKKMNNFNPKKKKEIIILT